MRLVSEVTKSQTTGAVQAEAHVDLSGIKYPPQGDINISLADKYLFPPGCFREVWKNF